MTSDRMVAWGLAVAASLLASAVGSVPGGDGGPASDGGPFCPGSVFYVADEEPGASDSNDGSSPTHLGGTVGPWKTLRHPAGGGAALAPGDVIVVRDGTYNGTLDVKVSGSVDCPVVFRAEGARAKLDGKGAAQAILMDGNNRKIEWLVFDGFEVTGADTNIDVTRSENITLRNLTVHDAGSTNINPITSHNVTIEDSQIHGANGEHGIYCSNGCDDLVVRNNTIRGNNWTGIQVNANPDFSSDKISYRAIIENNVIHGNGAGGAGALTFVSVRDSVVRNNLVRDNLAGGIILWAKNVAGYGCKGNAIVSNTVAFEPSRGWYGLSLQDDSSGNLVADNILVTGNGPALQTTSASFPLFSDHNVLHRPNGNVVRNLTAGNDLDLGQWQNASGQDRRSSVADPLKLFADPANGDFRLRPAAAAIDSGTSAPAVVPATDLDGNLRADDLTVVDKGAGPVTYYDIGAYEFPGVPPPPPQPLKVVLSPASTTTFPNSTLQLKLRVEDSISTVGVAGASGALDDAAAGGSFSAVSDDGRGNYSAVYRPVWYPADRQVTLTSNFTKSGHLPGSASAQVTVVINGTSPLPALELLFAADPTSVANPAPVSLLFTVGTANDSAVPGALITVNDGGAGGRVGPVKDLGAGEYEASYQPPNVSAKSTIALNARAAKSGYKEAHASLVVEVLPAGGPPPPPPPKDNATSQALSPLVLLGMTVVLVAAVLAVVALLLLRRRKPKEKYRAPTPGFYQER